MYTALYSMWSSIFPWIISEFFKTPYGHLISLLFLLLFWSGFCGPNWYLNSAARLNNSPWLFLTNVPERRLLALGKFWFSLNKYEPWKLGFFRELPNRSNVKNTLGIRLLGSCQPILCPSLTARLLIFTATLVVRMLVLKATMELRCKDWD